MDFVALDVETANPDWSSICQIGIVEFESGTIVDEWSTLVDPQDYFDPINTSIHGLTEDSVRGAPLFREILPTLMPRVSDQIVAHHMPFDRVALARAAAKSSSAFASSRWLDTARVARRAWDDCAHSGYGLEDLCEQHGVEFTFHHDALSDARACGLLLIKACFDSAMTLDEWFARVNQPISGVAYREAIAQGGNPDGPLHGETLVFTGTLNVPRREAAEMAARIGCSVADGVTKKTTILVVGVQDLRRTLGKERSSKHRKADALIAKGNTIKVLSEEDFLEMVSIATGGPASA